MSNGNKPPAPLAVYWLPSTREELRRSELLVSDELTSFAELCVAMRVIRPDDYVRIAGFPDALGNEIVDNNIAVASFSGDGHYAGAT